MLVQQNELQRYGIYMQICLTSSGFKEAKHTIILDDIFLVGMAVAYTPNLFRVIRIVDGGDLKASPFSVDFCP